MRLSSLLRVPFGLLAVMAVACDAPPPDASGPSSVPLPVPEARSHHHGAEEAFPGRIGIPGVDTYETKDGPREVHYLDYEGVRVVEGDILLPPPGRVRALGTGTAPEDRWPGGVVPYVIDSNLLLPQRVHNAIKHWQDYTRIRFVPRTTQTDYVVFKPGEGCSSHIGRMGGPQDITVGDLCSQGSVIHEIGHAVGMFHEQSRADRDNHVNIYWVNILAGKEHNFQKHTEQTYYGPGQDIGPYDFGSVMHYDSCAFSTNGGNCDPSVASGRTILKKDLTGIIANREALSSLDQQAVAAMYGPRPPAAPTNLRGGPVSSSEVWLDWNDNTEANLRGYVVYRNGVLIARIGKESGSSYADRGLPANSDFKYEVTAYALDTSEGSPSAPLNTFTPQQAAYAEALWRYWNGSIIDHFYTIDRNDGGLQGFGYVNEGYEGRLFRYQYRGSVPLYRAYCGSCGDHLYTTDWTEISNAAPAYSYQRVEGYLFPVQYSGTVPLHRYFRANGVDHFYTVTRNDSGLYGFGYSYEGVTGYVYP
jgi:hypothetical protein